MTCHFCIVGCGYHVYKWEEGREGGRAPNAERAWARLHVGNCRRWQIVMTPAMTNVVDDRGRQARRNIMVVPDKAMRRE